MLTKPSVHTSVLFVMLITSGHIFLISARRTQRTMNDVLTMLPLLLLIHKDEDINLLSNDNSSVKWIALGNILQIQNYKN